MRVLTSLVMALAGLALISVVGAVVLRGILVGEKPNAQKGPHTPSVIETTLKGGSIPVRIWAPAPSASGPLARASTGGGAGAALLIYVPAWGGERSENDVLLRELASHGFIVLAFDDIYHDPVDLTLDPADEAARVSPFIGYTEAEVAAFPDLAGRRVRLGMRKLENVLSALESDGVPAMLSPSTGRSVGLIGYSFGGAVAGAALVRDPRIRLAVNLDGWLPPETHSANLQKPYLAIYAEVDLTDAPRAVFPRRYWVMQLIRSDFRAQLALSENPNATIVLIAGADHSDFSDGLYRRERWTFWRPWRRLPIATARMRQIVDDYLLAFLNTEFAVDGASALRILRFQEVRPISALASELAP